MAKYLSEDGTATSHYEYLLWCLSKGRERIPGVGYLHIRDLIEQERDRDMQYKIEEQERFKEEHPEEWAEGVKRMKALLGISTEEDG